jgi:hypothetical protein
MIWQGQHVPSRFIYDFPKAEYVNTHNAWYLGGVLWAEPRHVENWESFRKEFRNADNRN